LRQQRLGAPGALFQPVVAAFGKSAVARELAIAVSLGNVRKLTAYHVWLIEMNWLWSCRRVLGHLLISYIYD
jgi:hypothetical protein